MEKMLVFRCIIHACSVPLDTNLFTDVSLTYSIVHISSLTDSK